MKLKHQILGERVHSSLRISTGFVPGFYTGFIFVYDFCIGQELERFQR